MKQLVNIIYLLYCGIVFAAENDVVSQSRYDVFVLRKDLLDQADLILNDQQTKYKYVQKDKNKFLMEFESCKNYVCQKSKIIEYAYLINSHTKKCRAGLYDISGDWVDKYGGAIYKTLSLATYKGRPASYSYIAKEHPSEGIEDAFGNWRLVGCEINTIEVESNSGRIFIPGLDLLVLRAAGGDLVVTDGENIYSYMRPGN